MVLTAPVAGADDCAPGLLVACREALDPKLLAGAAPDALEGDGAAGSWRISCGQMDGAGAAEAWLVSLPAGRSGSVEFLASDGDRITRQSLKLRGGPVSRATVRFLPYGEDRSLAHVDGGSGGQVLVHWDGSKLNTVWKVGKVRDRERHWFDVEDVDGDGIAEVMAYFRRELDVFFAEDEVDEPSAGARTDTVDLVAVYRLDGGKWKKDSSLLEARR
jgi:hypothetical protein